MTRTAKAMAEYDRRVKEAVASGETFDTNELAAEVAKDYKLHPVTFARYVIRK